MMEDRMKVRRIADLGVVGVLSVTAAFFTGVAVSGVRAADSLDAKGVIDIGAIDTSVSACENFYRFACGTWIARNPVPPDRARWSRFDSLSDRNQEKLRGILE